MRIENIKKILSRVKNDSRENLDLLESREVLKELGIRLNPAGIAISEEEAVNLARTLGMPVAMKIVSPDILHKTEAGGVMLNISDEKAVRESFNRIIKNASIAVPNARIKGVMVEKMIKGNELIVGTVFDPVFGNMIMFGIGGVLVELYKDVTFRLLPVKRVDILEMLDEIKAKEILNGYRKSPPVKREEIVNIMLNIGALMDAFPEIKSMEINPLIITSEGLMAIDARVILG